MIILVGIDLVVAIYKNVQKDLLWQKEILQMMTFWVDLTNYIQVDGEELTTRILCNYIEVKNIRPVD